MLLIVFCGGSMNVVCVVRFILFFIFFRVWLSGNAKHQKEPALFILFYDTRKVWSYWNFLYNVFIQTNDEIKDK